MTNPNPSQQVFSQLTGRAVEAVSLWADANQRILRELVDLSATTAKEGVRLYAEIQSSAVEAMKESQAYLLRRQSELSEAPRDPMTFCQKGMVESVEGTQHGVRLFESTAQAVTRSAERLQLKTEQAASEIQSTVIQLVGKMKPLYAPLG
jgi:hypothetical protein